MGQHYTRATVSASGFCNKCQKNTQHRVDDRRLGPCLDCIAKLDERASQPKVSPVAEQERLFK